MARPDFNAEKAVEEILKMDTAEQKPDAPGHHQDPAVSENKNDFNFSIKPEELEAYLNRYVVDQEEAVEIIATKVCTHFNRMNLEKNLSKEEKLAGSIKSNILLIGPTGVGKTFIIKLIAGRIGVPFVKADATKFSETGYVGGDVEDLVRELVYEADGDISRAEYGIIYIDEIDKIASSEGIHGPDVSRSGVQRNLLKLMEEADVDLKTPHDLASQVEAAMEAQKTGKVTRKVINTRNILFIVSGAFQGIEDIIGRRLNRQAIGFGKNRPEPSELKNILKKMKTEDLLRFGFESEFIGRLPVCVILNHLDEEGLYRILSNSRSSVIHGKKLDFRAYGIDINFTDEALRILAREAWEEHTGARGLLTVFERLLISFEKKLPSTEITSLTVDRELIDHPKETLASMVLKDGLDRFSKKFFIQHGVLLRFDEEAAELIGKKTDGGKITDTCMELFGEYYHGIRMLKMEEFTITGDAVRNPEAYMSEYISRNYSSGSGQND